MKKYYINQNIKSANISNVFRNGLKNSVLNLADFRAAVNNIAGKTLTACEINHLLGTSCAFSDKIKKFAEELV